MLERMLEGLYELGISGTVRESLWLFPALECIHLYSMVFLITVVAAFDLRLMGVKFARQPLPLTRLSKLVIKMAWGCFIVNLVTGVLLFMSKAPDYYINPAFRIKILLILFGLIYHAVLFPMASKWENVPSMSLGTKVAGVSSLLLWIGVIAASRWIAFT